MRKFFNGFFIERNLKIELFLAISSFNNSKSYTPTPRSSNCQLCISVTKELQCIRYYILIVVRKLFDGFFSERNFKTQIFSANSKIISQVLVLYSGRFVRKWPFLEEKWQRGCNVLCTRFTWSQDVSRLVFLRKKLEKLNCIKIFCQIVSNPNYTLDSSGNRGKFLDFLKSSCHEPSTKFFKCLCFKVVILGNTDLRPPFLGIVNLFSLLERYYFWTSLNFFLQRLVFDFDVSAIQAI